MRSISKRERVDGREGKPGKSTPFFLAKIKFRQARFSLHLSLSPFPGVPLAFPSYEVIGLLSLYMENKFLRGFSLYSNGFLHLKRYAFFFIFFNLKSSVLLKETENWNDGDM